MNILNESSAQKVWFDENNMWILLSDGRQLSVPLAYFPRLEHATIEQREKVIMSGGGTGLHWEEIDEDVSVPHLLAGHMLKPAVTQSMRNN